MDHPQRVERPITCRGEADKKQKAAEQAERKRELNFKSHAHDMERLLGRERAEVIASILTGYTPKR